MKTIEKISENKVQSTKMQKLKQKGAGAVEYALVLAVVVTLVVGLSGGMKDNLTNFFGNAIATVNTFMGGGKKPE